MECVTRIFQFLTVEWRLQPTFPPVSKFHVSIHSGRIFISYKCGDRGHTPGRRKSPGICHAAHPCTTMTGWDIMSRRSIRDMTRVDAFSGQKEQDLPACPHCIFCEYTLLTSVQGYYYYYYYYHHRHVPKEAAPTTTTTQ